MSGDKKKESAEELTKKRFEADYRMAMALLDEAWIKDFKLRHKGLAYDHILPHDGDEKGRLAH